MEPRTDFTIHTQLNSIQRASMDAGVKTPQCPHLSRCTEHLPFSRKLRITLAIFAGIPSYSQIIQSTYWREDTVERVRKI